MTAIKNLWTFLKQKIRSINYRMLVKSFLKWLGRVLHYLAFEIVLPKKYRQLSKNEIYVIIFKSNTPAGKRFDVWLLVAIVLNILLMIVDSFTVVREGPLWVRIVMELLEWGFTLLFTLEYYLRIYSHPRPVNYVVSMFGVIDFFSIFPAYLSLFFPAAHTLTVLRLLRTLRIFRIFKMRRFLLESRRLINALRRSAVRVLIFMMFVFIVSIILGAVMYAVELDSNDQITSIPQGIYWAVVTLTTVGYGDIAPVTPFGRLISVIVMILGYSIIAVPTGIVAGETIEEHRRERRDLENHDKKS